MTEEARQTGARVFIIDPMWFGMMLMLGAFTLTKAVCVVLGV